MNRHKTKRAGSAGTPGAALLTMKELAAAYGLSRATVKKWRDAGLPCAEGRKGKRLFFDRTQVDAWLGARGIVPGAHGVEGGRARHDAAQEATAGPAPEPVEGAAPAAGRGLEPLAEEMGLDPALVRVRRIEWEIGRQVLERLRGTASEEEKPTAMLALIRQYDEVLDQLRKVEGDAMKVQQMRGDLVQRVDVRDTMGRMAGMLRTQVERLVTESPQRITSALVQSGALTGDGGAALRAIEEEMRRVADAALKAMSEALRGQGGSLETDEGKDAGSGG